jgi:hypothetical protein
MKKTQQFLDAQIKEYELRLKDAETQKQSLNMSYDTIKANYDALIKARDETLLAIKTGKVESLRFKIVDAPSNLLQPSSPKRKLLFSGVFAGSIMIGLATAFLLFISTNFGSSSRIRQLIKRAEKNNNDNFNFSSSVQWLVLFFSCLMVVEVLDVQTLSLPHFFQSMR